MSAVFKLKKQTRRDIDNRMVNTIIFDKQTTEAGKIP